MARIIRQNCFLKIITILIIFEFAKVSVSAFPADRSALDAHLALFEGDDSKEIEFPPAGCYRFVGGEFVEIKNCFTNPKVGSESGRFLPSYSERQHPSPKSEEAQKAVKELQRWSDQMEQYRKLSDDIENSKREYLARSEQIEREERERKERQERMHGGGKIGSIIRAIGKFFSSIFD